MVWLTGWNRRKSKTINGSTSLQTDYQMKLTIYKGSGTDTATDIYLGTNVRDDFGDIRFTSSDGSTLLNYWIESYISATSAIIWVKISYITASPDSTTIYIYYDNVSATSASNENNTFNSGLRTRKISSTILLSHLNNDYISEIGSITGHGAAFVDSYDPSSYKAANIVKSSAQGIGTNILRTVPFTWEGLIKFSTLTNDQYIFSNSYASSGGGLLLTSTNQLKMVRAGIGYSSGYIVSMGTWYHVAISHNGTTMKLYIDDLLTYNPDNPTLRVSWTTGWTDSGSAWGVGCLRADYQSSTFDMNGAIDEVACYGEIRTTFPRRNYSYAEPTFSTTGVEEVLGGPICPSGLKYEGDTVHLSATPRDGIGPYYIEFRKNSNPIASYTGAPENIEITYDHILSNEDIRTAFSGTIDFSVYIEDSCPTGPQSCGEICTITIGCLAPVCNFTVV